MGCISAANWMSRSRNIKPGFFKNEELADLDAHTRLLFIGVWLLADRDGRFENRPRKIKAEIFPYEDVNVEACIAQLCAKQFLTMYEVDGEQYIEVTNWHKHQTPHHRETASDIPPPPQQKRQKKQRDADAQSMHQPSINEASAKDGPSKSSDVPLIPDSGFLIPDSDAQVEHLVPGLDLEAWNRWLDYRKQIRKPIKPVSVLAAQRELAGFGLDQRLVVEKSIANGWQGVFALDRPKVNGTHAEAPAVRNRL